MTIEAVPPGVSLRAVTRTSQLLAQHPQRQALCSPVVQAACQSGLAAYYVVESAFRSSDTGAFALVRDALEAEWRVGTVLGDGAARPIVEAAVGRVLMQAESQRRRGALRALRNRDNGLFAATRRIGA